MCKHKNAKYDTSFEFGLVHIRKDCIDCCKALENYDIIETSVQSQVKAMWNAMKKVYKMQNK